jgi:hypothetical protein
MKRATKEATRQAILEYNKRVMDYITSDKQDQQEQDELNALWDTIAKPLIPLKEIKKNNV